MRSHFYRKKKFVCIAYIFTTGVSEGLWLVVDGGWLVVVVE